MHRHRLKLKLSIRFSSKWHTGSGEGNLLTDRLLQRDARGMPYIPGSTLKGVIRENCEKLSRTLGFKEPCDPHSKSADFFNPLSEVLSPVDRLFGNKFEEGGLYFRNAYLSNDSQRYYFQTGQMERGTHETQQNPGRDYHRSYFQTRVQMNRKLRTAKDAHLFTTEYGFSPDKRQGDVIEFATFIDGHHQNLVIFDEADPPYAYCLLLAAIRMTNRLGGDKSTGAGHLENSIAITSFQYNDSMIDPEKYFREKADFYLDSSGYLEMREGS